jgi:ABC-type branched-subunit amino acid transport system substrate-binding protein
MVSEALHTLLEDKKIRFGIGVPLSGRGASLGREMAQAIQITVDETNASGEIQGARVDSSTLDDKGGENEGLKVAQSFARDTLGSGVSRETSSERPDGYSRDRAVPVVLLRKRCF